MPFTFSHPAIVLPLTFLPRKWYSLTGLVIGSLTPDFEYFLRMKIQSNYSHTIHGIFWFDLPLGLLLAFIFHSIVRNQLLKNLPNFLKSRFVVFTVFSWNEHFKRNWLIVLLSLFFGATSHIFWDSFTHPNGYFVTQFHTLSGSVNYAGIEIPIFKVLQHSSTLLGGFAIAFSIYQMPIIDAKRDEIVLKYWFVLFGCTVVIVATIMILGLHFIPLGNFVVTTISAVLIALTVTPLLLRAKN